MNLPSVQTLYEVTDKTWPAAEELQVGPWKVRRGEGGGQRVSATTAETQWTDEDIEVAENAMLGLSQPKLFMIRESEHDLDLALERRGYRIKDPVNLYAAPILEIDVSPPELLTAIETWPPLAAQRDVWKSGGIGPERVNVMVRANTPKTTILGRANDRTAGTGYIAIHRHIAMFHALETAAEFRRQGLGRNMVKGMARWARTQNAKWLSLIVTQANDPANALYSTMGFRRIGQYHYRIKDE